MSVDLNIISRQVNALASDIGRATLHQLYPKDFEYYMIALELVDGAGDTIDYFAFPVMPTAITKTETKRVNVRKAFKSTLVLTSTAFTPQDLTVRGNFGRNFRILTGTKEILSGVAFLSSTRAGVFELNQLRNRNLTLPANQFSRFIKTGYGATKILQAIINKSDGTDQNGAYRLYFYNYALGESYLVVAPAKPLVLEQNDANMNMIWHYTLSLTIVAPLDFIKLNVTATSNARLLAANVIQSGVNQVGRGVANYVSRVLR